VRSRSSATTPAGDAQTCRIALVRGRGKLRHNNFLCGGRKGRWEKDFIKDN
jgi:hypothetical protein